MKLSELIKQGFIVKVTHNANGRKVELQADPIEVEDEDNELQAENGKVLLKAKILVPELKAQVDAEIECGAKELGRGRFILTPYQIVHLDDEELDVISNAIEFVQYIAKKKALIISFNRLGKDGRAYVYFNVPATVYSLLAVAESKGRFFHSHIDGKFQQAVVPDTADLEAVEELVDAHEYSESKEGKEQELKKLVKTMNGAELLELVKREDVSLKVKEAVVYNPLATAEALDLLRSQLSNDNGKMTIREILRHPNCSVELLTAGSVSSDEYWQRASVAENPNTPVTILENFLKDNSLRVRFAALKNPAMPVDLVAAYTATKGAPQGYVEVPQWYSDVAHIDLLKNPSKHTSDAKSITTALGAPAIKIEAIQPKPSKGFVIMRVESDGTLTQVDENVDSSD